MKILLLFVFLLLNSVVYAKNIDPVTVDAIVTATHIQFSPDTIPENTPFVIHVLNQSGTPVELENADTSVEIYADMDKTFKVGLAAGKYIFFNDFNTQVRPAILVVKTATEYASTTMNYRTPIILHHSSHAVVSHLADSEILFIVWREGIEALLVVGIVYSWLQQSKNARKSGMFFLWVGVGIGLLCAILLSFVLITIKNHLPPDATNYFQASMDIIAAFMIVYMVRWMRNNGRMLKSGMHHALEKNSSNKWRNISIVTVVAVALAREASEASIFIYALGLGGQGAFSVKIIGILALGVALATLTIYILQLGNKIISWKFFFKITEILLLLLGGGLILNCADLLISSGFLPAIYSKVWDTSFLLGDGGFFTPIIFSFTGYRATPSLMNIIIYSTYWVFIYILLKPSKSKYHAK